MRKRKPECLRLTWLRHGETHFFRWSGVPMKGKTMTNQNQQGQNQASGQKPSQQQGGGQKPGQQSQAPAKGDKRPKEPHDQTSDTDT